MSSRSLLSASLTRPPISLALASALAYSNGLPPLRLLIITPNVLLGKGFGFYTCHIYQGKAVIRNVEMFMEPLLHIEPLRLKMMGVVLTVMDKIGLYDAAFNGKAFGGDDSDVGSPRINLTATAKSNPPVDSQSLRESDIQLNEQQGQQNPSVNEMDSPSIVPGSESHRSMGEILSAMDQGSTCFDTMSLKDIKNKC